MNFRSFFILLDWLPLVGLFCYHGWLVASWVLSFPLVDFNNNLIFYTSSSADFITDFRYLEGIDFNGIHCLTTNLTKFTSQTREARHCSVGPRNQREKTYNKVRWPVWRSRNIVIFGSSQHRVVFLQPTF